MEYNVMATLTNPGLIGALRWDNLLHEFTTPFMAKLAIGSQFT